MDAQSLMGLYHRAEFIFIEALVVASFLDPFVKVSLDD